MLDEPLETKKFILEIGTKADRLDRILAKLLPDYSRSRVQDWIECGHVSVNGKSPKESKVRQIVGPLDEIEVCIQPDEHTKAFQPEQIDFQVLEESKEWIVIGKPAGLVTHPGAGNWSGTLLNGLLFKFPELSYVPRAGIVHRLDKDTSGILVVARTEAAQLDFVKQLQSRTMGRSYIAIVSGCTSDSGSITDDIGRDPRNPIKMASTKQRNPIAPKEARTHFTTLSRAEFDGKNFSLLLCKLETGRTHQIRVHLSSINHPLLGDSLYGGPDLKNFSNLRQMLHAYKLEFNDPKGGNRLAFTCEIDKDMREVMNNIFGEVEIKL